MLQTTPTNIRLAVTRYGKLAYVADDRFIGKSLELYGEYSEGEVELWRKLIKPGWRVIDVGANIGYFSMALASLVGSDGTVWAVEPQPETFALLQRNTHKYKQVHCLNVAALDRLVDALPMPALSEIESHNYGGAALGSGGVLVPAVTLDRAIGGPVQFIKMDIEGAELAALQGAQRLLQSRPLLYLEEHPDAREPVADFVAKLGYAIYEHKPPLFRADNLRANPDDAFCIDGASIVSYNILCIPQEQLADYRELLEAQHDGFTRNNRLGDLLPRVPKAPAARNSKTGWAAVARLGGVGDNLIAASVCRPLKQLGYQVEVFSQLPASAVFENNPHIDKISTLDNDDLPKDAGAWQRWFVTAAKNYDRFAHLSHSCEVAHAFFPAMTQFWWPQDLRRKLAAGSYLETAHAVMGVPLALGPLFFPTVVEHEQARNTAARVRRRGPLIGWCMAGSRVDKIYPQAPFVIGRLIRELDASVLLLAAPPPHRDFELAKQAIDMVAAQNGSLDGIFHAGSLSLQAETWPIRRILTMAQHCDLVIGPDTGPMWGVAFEPVAKILLHSHASVDNIASHWVNTVSLHADPTRVPCWPCHRLHDDLSTCVPNQLNNGAACISDIAPAAIIAAVHRLLATEETSHA